MAQKQLSALSRFSWLFFLWFAVIALGLTGSFFEFLRTRGTASPVPVASPLPPAFTVQTGNVPAPLYTSRSVWVYDRNSQQIIYQDDDQVATSVASLAKLMTALVAYEGYGLEKPVTIGSASAVIGNRAKFSRRDVFSSGDLLKAMLIFSANDAAEALAEAHEGGKLEFIQRMNEKAQSLGLNHTHFQNSFGMDDTEQYSSAADIGRLADAVIKIPFLEQVVSMQKAIITEQRTQRQDVVYTTNELLRKSENYLGVKTGTTDLAGESLAVRYKIEIPLDGASSASASVEVPTREFDLLVVLLGSADRYQDAQNIVRWLSQVIVPSRSN